MDHAAYIRTRPSPRSFVFWLLVAVTLHGLLLLWPGNYRSSPQAVLNTLSVTFSKRLQVTAPPQPATAEITHPQEKQQPQRAAPALPERAEPGPASAPPILVEPEPAEAPPSAALLFGSTERLQLPHSEPESPGRLGRQRLAPPPPNWLSGTPGGEQQFRGGALPARAEVVDRWLAADGSHNVLVETTSGDVYCGRAAAWDPMQPLVEPVMMFRACGKGRRTFEWPDELRSRPAPAPRETR